MTRTARNDKAAPATTELLAQLGNRVEGVYASGMMRPSVQGSIHSVPRCPMPSSAASRALLREIEIAGQARNDKAATTMTRTACNDKLSMQ